MAAPLRIGLSACFFHADPQRPLFKGKTLLYVEQSLAHWVLSENVLASLIPSVAGQGPKVKDLVDDLDGLVLQGGSDVAPQTYGEKPLRPEWAGDAVRDRYEIDLVQEFLRQEKPILGICRGAQLLNVACGGTLYQDIQTQVPGSRVHRNWEIYDQNFHQIRLEKDSFLEKLYPATPTATVNTVHHQAVKDLGKGLQVEAVCTEDGVVEAIRLPGKNFVFAFQWHPEFQDPKDPRLLDSRLVLREYLKVAQARKQRGKT